MWFKRRDPRIQDEIRFHRDRLIEDYLASGMRPQGGRAARVSGVRQSSPQIEEAVRDARGRWFEDLRRDLRYTLRATPPESRVFRRRRAVACPGDRRKRRHLHV